MDIKCGRCRVFLPTGSFTFRRNGNLNKTCDKCLVFRRNYKRIIKGKGVLESEIPKDTYIGDPIGEKKKCGRCKVDLDISKFAVRRNGTTNSQCGDCINWVREYEGKKKQKINKDKHKNCDGTRQRLCSCNCKWCYSRSFASSPKAAYWSQKNQTKPRDEFISSGRKFWFDCDICDHEFEAPLSDIKSGRWCPYCSNKLCKDEGCEWCYSRSFASSPKALCWSEKNQTKPRDESINSHSKFLFNCDGCDHEFQTSLNNIKNRGCPYCAIPSRLLCKDEGCIQCYSKSFASSPREVYWSEKNKTKPRDEFINGGGKFWFNCEACDHEFETRLYTISSGHWCPYCANKKLCEDQECEVCYSKSFASSKRALCWSKKNHKTPRDVFIVSDQKFWFTCDKCECDFEAAVHNVTNGTWCPKCKWKTQSKLQDHLTKRYPNIIREARFDWAINPKTARKFRYDFLLDPYNIFIELDGPQHFSQISNWTPPKQTQKYDRYKERLAVFYEYTVIRLLQEDVLFDRHNWVEKLDSILGLCNKTPKIYHMYSPNRVQEIEYKTQLIFK